VGFEVDIKLVALHLVSLCLPLFHYLEGVVEKIFVDRLEK